MNKKKRVIRLLTIIYVIFFVNVGIGLLLTKYRVMVVVPMFILIMLQCQLLLGNFIKKVKFPYILLRLMLIIIIGLNFISDIELLIGNRIIAIVFILVVVFLVYKKWLIQDIKRIQKIPHVQYLYWRFGLDMWLVLFDIKIDVIWNSLIIVRSILLLLFMLEIIKDVTIEKEKKQIVLGLLCWYISLLLIGITGWIWYTIA